MTEIHLLPKLHPHREAAGRMRRYPTRRRRPPSRHPAAAGVLVAALGLALVACGSTPVTDSPGSAVTSVPGASAASASSPPTAPGSPALPRATPGVSPSPTESLGPTASGTGRIDWRSCTPPFECATVSVPIDYDHPGSGSIALAVIRLPATDRARWIGNLLTNPGGPGASGVDFVASAAQTVFSAKLRAQFDIVGFDPRGIGQSSPIECVDAAEMDRLNALDPVPDMPGERTALISGAQAFDAGCAANGANLLPFMSTIDAAKDMEQIRIALGDLKLTYLGFSYGTFLGSTYANLFPDRVRAFVLDGAVDSTLSFAADVEGQARGFAGNFSAFLADCAARPACPFYNGGHPGPAYDTLMAGVDASPLPATGLGDPRPVGPGAAFSGVIAALYDQASWPVLAQALALAQGGDGSLLLALADSYNERGPGGTYSNIAAANTAVNCADYTAPTDLATYDALATRLGSLVPRFGAAVVYGSLSCAFWPFHPSHDPVAPTARGAPPILVVGTTGDPATPYAGAVKLAQDLESGVLLTRKGEGHTAYGGKSVCIDSLVDAYLLSLSVPRAGTICP